LKDRLTLPPVLIRVVIASMPGKVHDRYLKGVVSSKGFTSTSVHLLAAQYCVHCHGCERAPLGGQHLADSASRQHGLCMPS
jgi:hypothetical protein